MTIIDIFSSLLITNSSVIERMQCTREDKEQIAKTIELFGEITERSRQVGYNCLGTEYLDKIDDGFFRAAILLRLDSDSSDIMINTLLPYILTSGLQGKEFVEKLVILNGIARVTQGEHPILLTLALYSFIGDPKGYENFVQEKKDKRR